MNKEVVRIDPFKQVVIMRLGGVDYLMTGPEILDSLLSARVINGVDRVLGTVTATVDLTPVDPKSRYEK